MKKLHIHISVDSLQENVDFYSAIFSASPTVLREDYAKWNMLEPAVNFAISTRGKTKGLNHLGLQVDEELELQEITTRFDSANINYSSEEAAACCYANSNKHWIRDPQGIAWESFHTLGESSVMNDSSSACCIPLDEAGVPADQSEPCCIPNDAGASACC